MLPPGTRLLRTMSTEGPGPASWRCPQPRGCSPRDTGPAEGPARGGGLNASRHQRLPPESQTTGERREAAAGPTSSFRCLR